MDGLSLVPSEDAPGKFRLAHHACPHTGKYRGKQVFTPKGSKSGVQEIEA